MYICVYTHIHTYIHTCMHIRVTHRSLWGRSQGFQGFGFSVLRIGYLVPRMFFVPTVFIRLYMLHTGASWAGLAAQLIYPVRILKIMHKGIQPLMNITVKKPL